METAIVFFSRDNNTKAAAAFLAETKQAALIELKEKRTREGFFGFMKSGYQAARKKNSELIGTPWEEIKPFDTLYLMTPIWASSGTPAVNTFIGRADLAGKKLYIVTLQADPHFSGSRKTHTDLSQRIQEKNGEVVECYALHGARPGAFAGNDYLKEQLQTIFSSSAQP